MTKQLKDLIPDITKAAKAATKLAAGYIVNDLKREGPYTTGQFERAWKVEAPATNYIDNNLPDESYSEQREGPNGQDYFQLMYKGKAVPRGGFPRAITKTGIPRQVGKWGWGGYVIGNRMEYAPAAMDLDGTGNLRSPDSKKLDPAWDWFDRWYIDSSQKHLEKAVNVAFFEHFEAGK